MQTAAEGRRSEGGESRKKKVMVAIDGSDTSQYALEWALKNLGDSMADKSQLVVFTSQPVNDYQYIYTLDETPDMEMMRGIREDQKKAATTLLEKAKAICSRHGVIPDTITEVGDPKDTIRDAVNNQKVDLLVLGSHGRSALKRAFLGSVSNYCVHNVKCPVLVVRKPEA